MSTLVVILVAACGGIGVLLIAAGLGGRTVLQMPRGDGTAARAGGATRNAPVRVGAAVIGAGIIFVVTGWPTLAVAGAALGWWLPSARHDSGRHGRELALVEAIAGWAEQLRDTITAANGLEHAIGATATLAPSVLAGPIQRLAARVEYERLDDALRRFADEVDHPLADFVSAALITASQHQARELGSLLGHLAECARGEATMRTRVWVGRARTRSAVRIIVVVVVGFVAGLFVLDRDYLSPYDTAAGQVVLAVVLAIFGGSFIAMSAMANVDAPDRFIGRREAASS